MDDKIFNATKAGADGYLKIFTAKDFGCGVSMNGRSGKKGLARFQNKTPNQPADGFNPTKREREILGWLIQVLSIKKLH